MKLRSTPLRYCFVVLVALLSSNTVAAQESLPTLLYANPALLNPAMTGAFDGVWKFGATQRLRQATETSRFETTSFFAERSIQNPKKRWLNGGLGLQFWQDNAAGVLVTRMINANIAWEAPFGARVRYWRLRAGFQLGLLQRTLASGGFTFQDQFDPLTSTFSLPTLENLSGTSTPVRINSAFGLLFYRTQKIKGNPEVNYYIGTSIQNLLRPDVSFLGTGADSTRLSIRYLVHGGFKLRTRGPVDYNLHFAYASYNNTNSLNLSFFTRLAFFEKSVLHGNEAAAIFIGLTGRMLLNTVTPIGNEASVQRPSGLETLSPYLGMEFGKGFSFGFAYDLVVSRVTPNATSFGGIYFTAAYMLGNQKVKKSPALPFPLF